MIRTLSLTTLLLLAACAQPFEGQVATKLGEAGLPQNIADCMAKRWVDRLSLVQLGKIKTLAADLSRERGTLTVSRFLERIRAVDDPEVVEVVTVSAGLCALAG